jgi:hypothetical protein
MAKEEINIKLEKWINTLCESLINIHRNNACDTYEIKVGPIHFNVVLPQYSSFLKALNSFYTLNSIDHPAFSYPTIYCLEEIFLDQLPEFNFLKKELNQIEFKSRFSSQKSFIHYDYERGLLKIFSAEHNTYLFYYKGFDSLPDWEIYSPLKEFIHIIALKNKCWLAHAGSIAMDGRGVLLFGPGGNGKSTTTLAGIKDHFKTVGDDYLIIHHRSDINIAYPIYRTIKSYESNIFSLPDFFNQYEKNTIHLTGKKVYLCSQDKDGAFARSFEIIMNIGMCLDKNNSTKGSLLEDFNFGYFSQSTLSQIPLWIDKSTKLAEKIFQSTPKHLMHFNEGKNSLTANMTYISNVIIESHN